MLLSKKSTPALCLIFFFSLRHSSFDIFSLHYSGILANRNNFANSNWSITREVWSDSTSGVEKKNSSVCVPTVEYVTETETINDLRPLCCARFCLEGEATNPTGVIILFTDGVPNYRGFGTNYRVFYWVSQITLGKLQEAWFQIIINHNIEIILQWKAGYL